MKESIGSKVVKLLIDKSFINPVEIDADELSNILTKFLVDNFQEPWISVEEELPSFDEKVLVCEFGKEETIKINRLESIMKSATGTNLHWIEEDGYDPSIVNVTHWRRLPKF